MKNLHYAIYLFVLGLFSCKNSVIPPDSALNPTLNMPVIQNIVPTIDSLVGTYEGFFRKNGYKTVLDSNFKSTYISWDTTFTGSITVTKSGTNTIDIFGDKLNLDTLTHRSAAVPSATFRNSTTAYFPPNDSIFYRKCTGCYAPSTLDSYTFEGKKK